MRSLASVLLVLGVALAGSPATFAQTLPPGAAFFLLGEGGADVIPHQIVRTGGDRLYIFTSKQSSTTIRVYRTTGTGLPNSVADFAAPILLTAPSLPISLETVYDGGNVVHVLINTQAGQVIDYPFNTNTNTFASSITLATNGGTVPTTMYIGTIGVAAMLDKNGAMHVTYWTASNHVLHRAFTYNASSNVLSPVTDWFQVDTAGKATHPAVAISPSNNSLTVSWVSEAEATAKILVRTRTSGGSWGAAQAVSTAPAWVCTDTVENCNGVNIDQGPSLVVDSAGVIHLIYIEAFDYTVYGDYGRIHYVKNSGGTWSDLALNALSHAPTLAIDGADKLYIIGHGHEKNPSCTSQNVMCVIAQASNGSWNQPQLFAQPPAGVSLDNSTSVKWSVVGFNRPETIEFVSYATPYGDTTLYYGRWPGTSGPIAPLVLEEPATPLTIGATNALTGTGFTGGSVIKLFVATSSGALAFGPYTPATQTPTTLSWAIPASVPLGNGFGSVQVVNTDMGYQASNTVGALLEGDPADNIPTILFLNGQPLGPADPSIGVAHVDTVVAKGSTVTITGTGFSTSNPPGVNLFTATGNVGPLTPLAGATQTTIQVQVPPTAPTGPGNFQVVNSPYTGNVASNAVAATIGAAPTITSVSVVGPTVTVAGTGFCSLSVINLFNKQGASVVNLGGLNGTAPKIPLTVVNDTQLSFTVPAGAVAGAAFVEVLNPPYIPFASSGSDPDGAFTIP